MGRWIYLCCIGLLCVPAELAVAQTRDVRKAIARMTSLYLKEHPDENKRRPPRGTANRSAKSGAPAPGGVGYGYWYKDHALGWLTSTVLDYFICCPDRVGGDMSYYLYLTASNRSNKGTEAFISYYQQNEALFRVFDWARPDGTQWQTSMNLPTDFPEYLTMRPDEFGVTRQMCRVRNATIYLGPNGVVHDWRNEVELYNFDLDTWDLVYGYDYMTGTVEENTFQTGEHYGSWGPIVEIFTESGTYNNLNPVGFDLCRLILDGFDISDWLSLANSNSDNMSMYKVISNLGRRSFVVYTGTSDRDGDGADFVAEAIANTDPDSAASVFNLGIYHALNPEQPRIFFNQAIGREYRLSSTENIYGAWSLDELTKCYTLIPLVFSPVSATARRYYRVGCEVSAGTLVMLSNLPDINFHLSPAAGLAASSWVVLPDGTYYEKIRVALPDGSYTISFDPVAGYQTPNPQNVNIINGQLIEIVVTYQPE